MLQQPLVHSEGSKSVFLSYSADGLLSVLPTVRELDCDRTDSNPGSVGLEPCVLSWRSSVSLERVQEQTLQSSRGLSTTEVSVPQSTLFLHGRPNATVNSFTCRWNWAGRMTMPVVTPDGHNCRRKFQQVTHRKDPHTHSPVHLQAIKEGAQPQKH